VELLVEGVNFGLLLLHLRLERRRCRLASLGALAEASLELLHLLLQRRHLQRERERSTRGVVVTHDGSALSLRQRRVEKGKGGVEQQAANPHLDVFLCDSYFEVGLGWCHGQMPFG